MPRRVHDFVRPERFVAGTVGAPGERTFFLQARDQGRVVSVALEKAQVAVLAERLGALLDEVRRRVGDEVPATAPVELEDVAPLDVPVEEEFRGGTMALAWDGAAGEVVVEVFAVPPQQESGATPEEADTDDSDVMRVRVGAAYARAFVSRAERVVAAGRPPCPLCGLPLDPDGHVCPRMNGHRH